MGKKAAGRHARAGAAGALPDTRAQELPGASAPLPSAAVWFAPTALKLWKENPKRASKAEIRGVADSMIAFGFGAPFVAREEDAEIIAGHTRLPAVLLLPKLWEKATSEERATWSEDASRIAQGGDVPVRLLPLSSEKAHLLALADNELGADWQGDMLKEQLALLSEEERLLAGWNAKAFHEVKGAADVGPGGDDLGDAPEPPAKPKSKPGTIYELGPHRLLCGDCTSVELLSALLGDEPADLLLMDPPYCSGGFQESGKGAGSIGTKARVVGEDGKKGVPRIANDTLSTRGFQALLSRVLELWAAGFLYCFTDWRMWIPLFDVAERGGFGVRSMIVWDKGCPGMGQGWRSQHEIVMFATKTRQKFAPKNSVGNVIQSNRSGNLLHPTQKPVDLLEKIIQVNKPWAKTACDPFAGSGSTLMAAARCGLVWRGAELSPGFCDVIRARWGEYARAYGLEPGTGAL